MKNFAKNLSDKDQQEQSFAGIFTPDEPKTNEDLVSAREAAAKNKPLDEKFSKKITNYIYNNIDNAIHGQELDYTMASIIKECDEVVRALSYFTGSEAKRDDSEDLFSFLRDYYLLTRDKKLTKEELVEFFNKNNYGLKYKRLIVSLKKLAHVMGRNPIKDIIDRNHLEQTASEITERYMEIKDLAPAYAHVLDVINKLDIEPFIALSDESKIKPKILKIFKGIKPDLLQIINWELEIINKSKFGYEKFSAEKKLDAQLKWENLKKIVEVDPVQIFQVDNYNFLDYYVNGRNKSFIKILEDNEKVKDLLDKNLDNSRLEKIKKLLG